MDRLFAVPAGPSRNDLPLIVLTLEDGAALLGFMGGDAASRWGALAPDAQRAAVLECLARWFGDAARRPRAYGFHDWTADFRQGGAPVTVWPPGVLSRVGAALRAPCGRVHFAGTEAAVKWTGYMDGAVRAGEAVAAEVWEGRTSFL